MILFFWFTYLLLSLLISVLVRRLFKSRGLKIFFFSLILSILISPWFSTMGQNNLSPVISIFFMGVLEGDQILTMRLLRPFITVFFIFAILDSLFYFWKSKT
tara:strand:+ start:83 stop:388 length:306 start_codon:yes stop_codon:yes gene_type:complete